MKKLVVTLFFWFIAIYQYAQSVIDKIPAESYTNFAQSYNYTFWDDNWLTGGVGYRAFSIQTSSFALQINYDDLDIENFQMNRNTWDPGQAFGASKSTIFPNTQGGAIEYAILQNGSVLHAKSNNPSNNNIRDSQMAEFGTWLNTRFVSTNFTNSAPIDPYFTGLEFTNWHDRLKMTFHVKPTQDISNGQLQLSVEIPDAFNNQLNNGTLYAFIDNQDGGIVVKGSDEAAQIQLNGDTISVTTGQVNLVANQSYEVSLIFYISTNNLSTTYQDQPNKESEIQITASQNLPNMTGTVSIGYNANQGIHYLDIPRYRMGYRNCNETDVLQNINLSLENNRAEPQRVRLCFRQIPNINVVGFNSMIRNDNGDPAGLPLQVSKNWHTSFPQLFGGSWIREYTEIILPANTTLQIDYTRTGAKWGETFSASSHQLSVAGVGIPRGGWLEAALGSFGESVTHSPDYQFGRSNVCDFRPFMVTNQNYPNGTSTECNWTGNVGGMDMWVYHNTSNQRIYQSQVKTKFDRYSPNLSETSISAYSSDGKFKWDYTFYLNRSSDFVRVYYKVKVKALENAGFNRFDIFQLGGDHYNYYKAQLVKYGNKDGETGELMPTNDGSNDYTTSPIALSGEDPWLWAGNGTVTNGPGGSLNIETNNGFIIRDYKAYLNGSSNNTPYFRERSSSTGFSASTGQNPTSYCIVPPPGINTFQAGDSIEMLIETVILPKQYGDYYGDDSLFNSALQTYGNSVDLFLREAQGNSVGVSSNTNVVSDSYPLSVIADNNTASVTISGGRNYVPIVFRGLTDISEPKLWLADDDCWSLVDQSTWGNDFWQANYIPQTGLFDLVYNVDQDQANGELATKRYYLGETPPIIQIIGQTKRNEEIFSSNTSIAAALGDSVVFNPMLQEGNTTIEGNGEWTWSGPNNFMSNSKLLKLDEVAESSLGTYELSYVSVFGCTASLQFELSCLDLNNDQQCDRASTFIKLPVLSPLRMGLFSLLVLSLVTLIIFIRGDTYGS